MTASHTELINTLKLARELSERAQELRRQAAVHLAGLEPHALERIAERSGYDPSTLRLLSNQKLSHHQPRAGGNFLAR